MTIYIRKTKGKSDQIKRNVVLFSCLILCSSAIASADDSTDIKTVVDDAPFISARAAGMGGALSTLADGIHAPFYNPAGIGGLHWERSKPPAIRQLHFPYIGYAANEATAKLRGEFQSMDGAGDKGTGAAIIDAHQGQRQYGRASGLLSLGIGRMLILQSTDTQLAAFRKENEPDPAKAISLHYRTQNSTGAGFSVTDTRETFYLGAFAAYNQRNQLKGDFAYDDLVRSEDRKSTLTPALRKYQGVSGNLGMIWKLGKYGRPALSLVNKNVGGARYHLKNDPAGVLNDEKTIVDPENLTMGFSLSPYLGRSGAFNFIIEGHHLTDKQVALNKKFRTAAELNFGGFGSEAVLGLRTGYNLAGASYGLNLNLGLIQFEVASHAEDIGTGNYHVVERRNVGVISVNVLYE
ncbi:MAG: hypothetical protein H6618_01865 [Deltaproteobacteria bacterium]|nr:hypothetical protein [Deltaproteobacteria bacterium]